MTAAQPALFDDETHDATFAYPESAPEKLRDPEIDPVAHLRHLPIAEQRKRCMARFVYRHRNELCLNPVDVGNEHRRITWAEWWLQRFGCTLDDYELQLKQQGI